MTHPTKQQELKDLRWRLEQVAENFGDPGNTWSWDATRMHLTIRNAAGDPLATLHVEYKQ